MKCISGGTISNQLCVNPCVSFPGMLQFFQNKDPGTFPKNKAFSVYIKGNGRPKRICFLRKRRKSLKSCNTCRTNTAFCSAGKHNLRVPILNGAECVADAVCSGSTCRHNIGAFSTYPQLNGNISCCHIGNHSRNHQRIYPICPSFQNFCVFLFNGRKTANSGSHDYTGTKQIFFCQIEAGILQGLLCCCDCILGKQFHPSCRFCIHFLFPMEIFYLSCKLYFKILRIKSGNFSDSYGTFSDVCPKFRNRIPDWRNRTQSGDHNSSFLHHFFLCIFFHKAPHVLKNPCAAISKLSCARFASAFFATSACRHLPVIPDR